MTSDNYVQQLLELYISLADTPHRPHVQDRLLARQLFDRGIDLQTISVAILLGAARRRNRAPHTKPLPTVRSLAYFLPILDELPKTPPPDGYLDYLLDSLTRTPSATLPIAKCARKTI